MNGSFPILGPSTVSRTVYRTPIWPGVGFRHGRSCPAGNIWPGVVVQEPARGTCCSPRRWASQGLRLMAPSRWEGVVSNRKKWQSRAESSLGELAAARRSPRCRSASLGLAPRAPSMQSAGILLHKIDRCPSADRHSPCAPRGDEDPNQGQNASPCGSLSFPLPRSR